MSDPEAEMAALHERLLAVQKNAIVLVTRDQDDRIALGKACLAAIAHTGQGDEPGRQAAVADITPVEAIAAEYADAKPARPNATPVGLVLVGILPQLKAIVFNGGDAPEVSVSSGFQAIIIHPEGPVHGDVVVSRTGDTKNHLSINVAVSGDARALVQTTLPALFFPNDTQAKAVVAFIPQPKSGRYRLTADGVSGRAGLVPPTGVKLGHVYAFDFQVFDQQDPPPPPPPGKFPILAKVDTHGHPHPSGGCGGSNEADMFPKELDPMAAWRGRPFSAFSLFSNRQGTWDNLASALGAKGPVFAEIAKRNAVLNMATPLFPAKHGSSRPFADLSSGAFDKYHAANAKAVAGFAQPAILAVRMSHEWLSGSQQDSPVHDPSGGADWCKGFARVSAIWRDTLGERCIIDLNSIRRPGIAFMKWIDALKPGVDYQVLGCDSYNNAKDGKYVTDQPSFDRYADNKGPDGSPWGVRAWFELAKAKGVMTSVPEYGCTTPPGQSAAADQPFYIHAMHDLFVLYRWMFLGDFYFNRVDSATGDHRVFDPAKKAACAANPKSAAAYVSRYQK